MDKISSVFLGVLVCLLTIKNANAEAKPAPVPVKSEEKAACGKCDDKCVDMQTDVKNCGECGVVCDKGATCVAGACIEKAVLDLQAAVKKNDKAAKLGLRKIGMRVERVESELSTVKAQSGKALEVASKAEENFGKVLVAMSATNERVERIAGIVTDNTKTTTETLRIVQLSAEISNATSQKLNLEVKARKVDHDVLMHVADEVERPWCSRHPGWCAVVIVGSTIAGAALGLAIAAGPGHAFDGKPTPVSR